MARQDLGFFPAVAPDGSQTVAFARGLITPAESFYTEGLLNYVQHDFGKSVVADQVASLLDLGSTNGTVTPDTTNGGAVFSTGAAAGNTVAYRSKHKIEYDQNPGHGILVDITLFREPGSADFTGDAYARWGLGDASNGFGYGYDATGLFLWMTKNGVDVYKEYTADWFFDPLDGGSGSRFVRYDPTTESLVPEALSIDFDNLFRLTGEFLYAAEQNYYVKSPLGAIIPVHTHQFPNNHTETSIADANLPIYVEIANDTSAGGNIQFRVGSMHGGVFSSKAETVGRNPDGRVRTLPAAGEDLNNSTTDTLLAAATYTGGDWTEAELFSTVVVNVQSDVDSAQDGLVLQFSDDGSTVRYEVKFTYDSAPDGASFPWPALWKYFRVKYSNGSTNQTSFSLQTQLHTSTIQSATVPRQANVGALPANTPVEIVRADLEPVQDVKQTRLNVTATTPTAQLSTPLANRRSVQFYAPVANNKNIRLQVSAAGSNWITFEPGVDRAYDWGPEVAPIYIYTPSGVGTQVFEIVEEA